MHRSEMLTAKGQRRKEALLRAAVDVIAEKGYAGVTHRAVAERAGVPMATTSYFFSSIHELVQEAAARYHSEQLEDYLHVIESFVEQRRSPAEGCELLANILLAFPLNMVLAHYECYLNAARVPELRPTVAEAFQGFERISEAALRAVGARRPEEGAKVLVALVDGLMMRRVANPSDDDRPMMEAALRQLFFTYAMDQDELDRWEAKAVEAPEETRV